MEYLDWTWIYEEVDRNYEMQDVIIKASNKSGLTKKQLLDTFYNGGVIAVYNLGMEHMHKYLKGEKNE